MNMKRIKAFDAYESPQCTTLAFVVESAILAASSNPSEEASLGSLNDNIFGEDFI